MDQWFSLSLYSSGSASALRTQLVKTARICLCLQESSAHENNVKIVQGVVGTEESPLPVIFIVLFFLFILKFSRYLSLCEKYTSRINTFEMFAIKFFALNLLEWHKKHTSQFSYPALGSNSNAFCSHCFVLFRRLYQWNHIVHSLLGLTSFTSHNAFENHPYCITSSFFYC